PRLPPDPLPTLFPYTTLFRSVANSVAHPALQSVVVIIEHFFEWTFVDHSLIALNTWSLFSLESLDRDGTELDSFHSLPWLDFTIDRKSTRLNSSHVAISYAVF